MTRRSFLLHIDSLDVLDELSNEEAGLLLKAMRDYHNDEEMQLDALTKIVFSPFKNQFNRDTLKYQTDNKKIKDLSPKVDVNFFLTDEIFQYWVKAMNKGTRTSLTTLRKTKISARLKDGYPVHEIKQAIDNVAKDSFLVAGGHTDIEMICRSDTNLEKYRDAMKINQSNQLSQTTMQNIETFKNVELD